MNYNLIKYSILSLAMLTLLPSSIWAKDNQRKRKNINWSINFNRHQDTIKTTLFNLGLITNIQKQSGLGINVLCSAVHEEMNGVQLAGVLSYAKTAKGVQICGLSNFINKDISGLMIGGLLNASGGTAKGVQLTILSNISTNVIGIQSSMISNIVSERMRGLQLAGVVNIAYDLDGALQLSSLTNMCLNTMNGVQFALGNYAEDVKGVQMGLLNLSTGQVDGWQVGIVNHSKDTTAHKIGLVNINPKTRIQAMVFGSNTSKINVAVRFKNRTNYSILGIGTHYLDLNDDFSGCLFYRTGLYFPLKKKFEVSGDLGYFHIENFEDENAEIPDRMYSLQARLNLSYRILPKLSLFATTGYAMTRFYKKNKLFENKGIIEAGIILF